MLKEFSTENNIPIGYGVLGAIAMLLLICVLVGSPDNIVNFVNCVIALYPALMTSKALTMEEMGVEKGDVE